MVVANGWSASWKECNSTILHILYHILFRFIYVYRSVYTVYTTYTRQVDAILLIILLGSTKPANESSLNDYRCLLGIPNRKNMGEYSAMTFCC